MTTRALLCRLLDGHDGRHGEPCRDCGSVIGPGGRVCDPTGHFDQQIRRARLAQEAAAS